MSEFLNELGYQREIINLKAKVQRLEGLLKPLANLYQSNGVWERGDSCLWFVGDNDKSDSQRHGIGGGEIRHAAEYFNPPGEHSHDWVKKKKLVMCKKCGWLRGGNKGSEPCKGNPGISFRGSTEDEVAWNRDGHS